MCRQVSRHTWKHDPCCCCGVPACLFLDFGGFAMLGRLSCCLPCPSSLVTAFCYIDLASDPGYLLHRGVFFFFFPGQPAQLLEQQPALGRERRRYIPTPAHSVFSGRNRSPPNPNPSPILPPSLPAGPWLLPANVIDGDGRSGPVKHSM